MNAQPVTSSPLAYPINETAALLRMSRRTVYSLLERGELRSVRIGGRQRIPARELDRLLQPPECAA